MQHKYIRVVRGSFIAVIIFVISIIMSNSLDTTAPLSMGAALFGLYLVAEWASANLGSGARRTETQSQTAVSALSSKAGGAIAGLAFVIGVVVILVAFFGLKTTA